MLTSIVKSTDKGGNFPVVTPICEQLLRLVVWNNKDEPEPQEGMWNAYDVLRHEIRGIEAELEEILKSGRLRFMTTKGSVCQFKI